MDEHTKAPTSGNIFYPHGKRRAVTLAPTPSKHRLALMCFHSADNYCVLAVTVSFKQTQSCNKFELQQVAEAELFALILRMAQTRRRREAFCGKKQKYLLCFEE